MTERERLRTLGLYYSRVTRNREKAIENYTKLVEQFPADDAAHNGLAIQYFYTLDFESALEAGGRLLEIYPKSVMGRSNYALYAMYASDFETAVAEAEKVRELDPGYFKGWLPVAMSALSLNDMDSARIAYESMREIGGRGASTANLGLADIAMYSGDFAGARSLLQQGIADDEAAGSQYVVSTKYVALGEAELRGGDREAALNALTTGLGVSAGESRSVAAAIVYLEAGETERAAEIAAGLKTQLQAKSRAHGLLIDGLIALHAGNEVGAIDSLTSGIELADLWLLRYYRGRAFLEAGFYAEALDEFTDCTDRKGEATAVFLDDLPSYRYAATLPYWLARAQQQLGMRAEARANYAVYIARRPEGGPLTDDARQRMVE
jgi:tetratricopeptide (TPR) repeat protein